MFIFVAIEYRQKFNNVVNVCVTQFTISFHIRLQKLLADTKEEAEALVKNYSSPAKLATFVVAMKRCANGRYTCTLYTDVPTVQCQIHAQNFHALVIINVSWKYPSGTSNNVVCCIFCNYNSQA